MYGKLCKFRDVENNLSRVPSEAGSCTKCGQCSHLSREPYWQSPQNNLNFTVRNEKKITIWKRILTTSLLSVLTDMVWVVTGRVDRVRLPELGWGAHVDNFWDVVPAALLSVDI